VLLLIPSLALAVLVYDWQDANDPDSSIAGTMIFADGVNFGDSIDPLSNQLLSFTFSNEILSDWSMPDFAYGNFLVPQEYGVNLDPLGFAIPGSTKKKAAAKKGGVFSFERDNAFLDFSVSGAVKKKAAKKTADGNTVLDPYPLWSWVSYIAVECPPGTACKKSAKLPTGEGYWVLKSGPVSVPEPATFLLTLTGLVSVLTLIRRRRKLFR
jgi:hypothetical protein